MLIFGDETLSRRHFCSGNSLFWRRDHFSSTFLGEKHYFLTTGLFLVTFLSRKTPFFDDETLSRHHFGVKNSLFWRRDSFSSSLLGEKLHFLATRHLSRRHFCMENSTFWRRNSFSSSLLLGKLHFLATKLFLVVILSWKTPLFGDETPSRHLFWAKNTIFWRRDSFSSTFLDEKHHFLATRRQDEMPNLASINRKLAHKISHTT
jgi:hypothetical protein